MPKAARSTQLIRAKFAIGLCAFGFAAVGLLWWAGAIERQLCPAEALLWGTSRFLQLLPAEILSVVALCLWMIVALFTNALTLRGVSIFGVHPPRLMLVTNVVAMALVGASLFLIANVLANTYCVMPKAVSYRDGLFAPTETFPWGDVVDVIATCESSVDKNGRPEDRIDYALVMRNQRVVDIDMSPIAAVVQITGGTLRNIPHRYDASGVSPRCSRGIADLLSARATAAE